MTMEASNRQQIKPRWIGSRNYNSIYAAGEKSSGQGQPLVYRLRPVRLCGRQSRTSDPPDWRPTRRIARGKAVFRVDLYCITGWLRGVSFLNRALGLHFSTDPFQKPRGLVRRVDGSEMLQSPSPGFGEKYWSLSDFPSHSFQSGGGVFLTVIIGHIFAYSAFSDSHLSSPGSVSALMASTGHSGSQTPQSMHSSGWITSMFSPS
jgi:hypothetical protein